MLLLRRRERDGAVESRDSDNWSIQIIKCLFIDDRRDFARNTASFRVLVKKDYLVGLADGLHNGISVEWGKRPQIENLQINSLFRQKLSGFERRMHHGSIGNHADVAPFACHAGFA